MLEKAIQIAVLAHEGQKDKAGQPYILHPLSVMFRVSTEEERIVAVLHDVIEDTHITPDELRDMGFSEQIIAALLGVTRDTDETYEEFIDRAKSNPLSRAVKLADLADNMRVERLVTVTVKDLERTEKYKRAVAVLEN